MFNPSPMLTYFVKLYMYEVRFFCCKGTHLKRFMNILSELLIFESSGKFLQ